ncbi:MAG: transglutaminase family protein, partial [Desulfuromonadales bacterium]|nr:transglutaminase family protein [Desulfuromonadales bacterium]NIS43949.1 transglutaminase family protein [Desulfuromonadales bacterium]
GQGRPAAEIVEALKAFYREQQLQYDNRNLPITGEPVDAFLFEHQRGYCEYFASSFATVLRLAGVPARLVGGYYGGRYNDLGGYYLVTDDMAHVWVEAYLEGRQGWVRVDPSTLAQNAGTALGASRAAGVDPWQRFADAFNYYWNRGVIAYDLNEQFRMLRRANDQLKGVGGAQWDSRLGVWLLVIVGAVAIVLGLSRWWRRPSAEGRLLRDLRRRLADKYDLKDIPESRGLQEIARQVEDRAVNEFVQIYSGAVYRDRKRGGGAEVEDVAAGDWQVSVAAGLSESLTSKQAGLVPLGRLPFWPGGPKKEAKRAFACGGHVPLRPRPESESSEV